MFIFIHILSYYNLFLYFNLCLSVMLDSLSFYFSSISFRTYTIGCSLTLICVFDVMLDNFSCAFSSTPFLNNLLFNSNYPNSRYKEGKKGESLKITKG